MSYARGFSLLRTSSFVRWTGKMSYARGISLLHTSSFIRWTGNTYPKCSPGTVYRFWYGSSFLPSALVLSDEMEYKYQQVPSTLRVSVRVEKLSILVRSQTLIKLSCLPWAPRPRIASLLALHHVNRSCVVHIKSIFRCSHRFYLSIWNCVVRKDGEGLLRIKWKCVFIKLVIWGQFDLPLLVRQKHYISMKASFLGLYAYMILS